jgi:hypothetical protein
MHRVEVVPWSIAITYRCAMIPAQSVNARDTASAALAT